MSVKGSSLHTLSYPGQWRDGSNVTYLHEPREQRVADEMRRAADHRRRSIVATTQKVFTSFANVLAAHKDSSTSRSPRRTRRIRIKR